MKLSIAYVTKYYQPHSGGIESHVQGIAEELVKKGLEVKVYTSNIPEGRKTEEINGVIIQRATAYYTLSNDPLAPGILQNLLRDEYDLIHVHMPDPFNSVIAYMASLINGVPLAVTYHADILKNKWYERLLGLLYYPIQYLILRHSRKIIATTPNYVEGSSVLRNFVEKIEIAPNFVDEEKFNPKNKGAKIRKKHKLKNKKVALFLGRLVPYKGVEYLIDSFKKVNKEMKDSVLLIVGDGILREGLKKQARGVKEIKFIKAREKEIPEYYAACDLFVLPSVTRQEAFGIALLEAMASGKPCITTNISGMPYVVGDCGITVTPQNTETLRYSIMELLSNDIDSRMRGECGRKRVMEYFTKKKVAERILNIYRIILY